MARIQTQKKETEPGQPLDNNNRGEWTSQEKTLVPLDTIPEKSVLKVYNHCVIFSPWHINKGEFEGKHGSRGVIKEFSKRSRFRLFKILAQIDDQLPTKPLFVSLTYHYGHLNEPKSTKSQLHIFLTRLRQFDAGVKFIWRIEFQIRKAPHYHLIIFPSPAVKLSNGKTYSNVISEIWHSIADPKSRAHEHYGCKVVSIKSYRKACIYLNKYVAKCHATEVDLVEGKHWGASRDLPFKCQKIIKLSDPQAMIIIKKIRLWLIKHGKYEQAESKYFHIYQEWCVFIDLADLNEVCDSDLPVGTKLISYTGH